MKCDKCGKEIGTEESIYQVRVGYESVLSGDYGPEFIPIETIGYYCSECLEKGIYA